MEENLSKNIILKQHNKITGAHYEMPALEKNIVYMFMSQLRIYDPIGKVYNISITELKNKLRSLGQEVSLEQIQEATFNLIQRMYYFTEESGDYVSMRIFAHVGYQNDSDFIEIKISNIIRPYLFDLKYDFTAYHLDSALSLKSKYSQRIYEMLSQHKDEGVFLISVQELRNRLKLKEDKLSGWTDFQKTILESSTKEINEKTELSATYTLKKTGPKYTGIEFHIEKKESSEPKGGLVLS